MSPLKSSLFAFLVVLTLPLAACADEDSKEKVEIPNLTISATADIDAVPDLAIISAGVISNASTAQAANAANRKSMNGLFQTLKDAGIAEKDMQTSGYNLSPQYVYKENQAPVISGYQVNNTVTVKIRDMDKIGPVMDAMVEVGGNQISGPSFTIDNPETALNSARKEAVDKAMNRARLYADAAGLKIARVVSIAEGGSYTPMPQPVMYARAEMAMAKDAGAPMPIAAGEVNMQASVTMRFELEPK